MVHDKPLAKPGWQVHLGASQKAFHYIDETGFSLCRRLGYYYRETEPHDGSETIRWGDCKNCWRRLVQKRRLEAKRV